LKPTKEQQMPIVTSRHNPIIPDGIDFTIGCDWEAIKTEMTRQQEGLSKEPYFELVVCPPLNSVRYYGAPCSGDESFPNYLLFQRAFHCAFKDQKEQPRLIDIGISAPISFYLPMEKMFLSREESLTLMNQNNTLGHLIEGDVCKAETTKEQPYDGICYYAPSHTHELNPHILSGDYLMMSTEEGSRLKTYKESAPDAPEFGTYKNLRRNIVQRVGRIASAAIKQNTTRLFLAFPFSDNTFLRKVGKSLRPSWNLVYQYGLMYEESSAVNQKAKVLYCRHNPCHWSIQYWEVR